MTYSHEQLKAMCPLSISECSQKHVQSVVAELIETALAQPASVPAGRKLVPVEPTLAMLDALRADTTPYLPDRYRAMLAAAPQAPQPEAQPGLTLEQEPKYTINGHAIVNRASGEEIPADEPVFIFRARDVHARAALAAYSCMLTPGGHREAVAQRLADFAAFSYGNPKRMKEPDTAAPSAQAEQGGK